ncbi:hypothetical protein F4780DRAFT_426800 [Xylariomycetidae sp. FL0641]|nr:hypothetical protein F4780DRAFT_426800 [Xylariomycetidae sp. FL0641]
MMISRQTYGGFVLTTACFFLLFLTSKRLGDWALESPYRRIPSLRYPYGHDSTNRTAAQVSGKIQPHARLFDPICDAFPNTANVLVVVKTGATEAYTKIPTQLMTNLRCVSDFLLFSDMHHHVAGYELLDALESVRDDTKQFNADFDLYRRQQACLSGRTKCRISERDAENGWVLDKYKNIHMAEKAFHLRPNYDWYLFVDADTYVVWPNLIRWLSKLDPTKKQYIGSVTMINDFPSAHGGSGYLLSWPAMHDLVAGHPGTANRYDLRGRGYCCGDKMLAVALNETIDLGVTQAWPTINGEKPYTIPFGPRQWCQPIVTMHHLNSEEMSSFFDFEREFFEYKAPRSPIVFKDIYEHFVAEHLLERREDWDNISDEVFFLDPEADHEYWMVERAKRTGLNAVEAKAHKSFDQCQTMCVKTKECFQFSYRQSVCSYRKGFLLGSPSDWQTDEDKRMTSGWDIKKIHKWIQEQGHCREPRWPLT